MVDELVPASASLTPQASSDEHLIQLWLDGRSRHTRRVYEADSHGPSWRTPAVSCARSRSARSNPIAPRLSTWRRPHRRASSLR